MLTVLKVKLWNNSLKRTIQLLSLHKRNFWPHHRPCCVCTCSPTKDSPCERSQYFLIIYNPIPKNDCTNVKQNSLSHWLRFNSWNGTPVFFLIFCLVVFHRNKGSNFFQYWIKKSIIGQFSLSHSYTFIIVAIVPAVYYLFLSIWKSRHWHIDMSIVTGIDSGIQIKKFYFYFQNCFLKKQNIYVLSCP